MLAGQVLVAGFTGTDAPEELLRASSRGELAGVILFKRNLGAMHQIASGIARIVASTPPDEPPLVAVDQEGGRVARVGSPVVRLPPMRRLAGLGDPTLTERAGRVLAEQLGALGFSMNFAPVLDVDTNPDNPVIGDRAFGATPAEVEAQAFAFARGLAAGGILACGKHFPGHGDTDLDSHLTLPHLPHARARLDAVELAPFRAARGRLPAIMTAHVVFEALRKDTPATLAREVVTDLLRGELGYDGAIVSDDLEMKAIADHYGIEQAACLAIEAGCDTLLVCSRLDWVERAREALAERATRDAAFRARLADAGERTLRLRRQRPPTPITDARALERALASEQAAALSRELEERLPAP
ncbi:MAG: beta-N-acetylhexosaminidase [Polyangiales bacterium]